MTKENIYRFEGDDFSNEFAALRAAGIDVVDGLAPSECVGRLPLFVYRMEGVSYVSSPSDGRIDYLGNASKETYPWRYYLFVDEGEMFRLGECSGLLVIDSSGLTGQGFAAEPAASPARGVARIKLYSFGEWGELLEAGCADYDTRSGAFAMAEGKASAAVLEICKNYHSLEARVWPPRASSERVLFKAVTNAIVPGRVDGVSYNDLISEAYDAPSTGVGLKSESGCLKFVVPDLPDASFERPFEERLTVNLGEDEYKGRWYSREIDLGGAPEKGVAMLSRDEVLAAAAQVHTSAYARYRVPEGIGFALVVSPAPQGCRRPVGHVIMKAARGGKWEAAELAVCRLNARFSIEDVYIRAKDDDGDAPRLRRCCGQTLRDFKELIGGDVQIIKGSLANAKNLRNRYAVDAAQGAAAPGEGGETEGLTMSQIRDIAGLPFGEKFVEWCYKLGKEGLADDVVSSCNRRRAWNGVAAMTDLIPGYDPAASSIYTCFGLPKAWGKAAFEMGGDGIGSLGNAAYGLRRAWALESALTGGKPSEAAVPARALEYAKLWMNARGSGVENRVREAFGDDESAIAEFMRSRDRMIRKALNVAGDTYQVSTYVRETFDAYCDLKAIGESPEEHGVYGEYGLPEDDRAAAIEMIRRRCEAAQETVRSYQAILDQKRHASQEADYAERRKAAKWLELKGDSAIDGYEFVLPKSLYGESEPFSVEGEAANQKNCLRSYLRRLADGEYTVVLMRRKADPRRSLVTIGINSGKRVDQTYGYRDRRVSKREADAISAWVAAVTQGKGGTLTLKSPGGWCAAGE